MIIINNPIAFSSWLALAADLLPARLPGQIPVEIIPEGVGVNIHLVTGYARDLDLIAKCSPQQRIKEVVQRRSIIKKPRLFCNKCGTSANI